VLFRSANAVATVIYTNTLRPTIAVVWSGLWNLTGVLLSSGAVAFGIVALLPVELVINVGSSAGFAMVFSLLISAMIWNVGTWYFGLPASSSHTLIGSIVGVGLANSMLFGSHTFGDGVNWAKVHDTLAALILSPIIGFVCAGLLLLLMKALIRAPELYRAPPKGEPPSPWIRALLILTCTGVSFAHGSNDGQKGMGLIMLIMIGILPSAFALNPGLSASQIAQIASASQSASVTLNRLAKNATESASQVSLALNAFLKTSGKLDDTTWTALATTNREITSNLRGKTSLSQVVPSQRGTLRSNIYQVSASLAKIKRLNGLPDKGDVKALDAYHSQLDSTTNYIPVWVKVAVALFLGFGTMIGWKRIVVTVGERIGKAHMTYAQGASAEIVAYATDPSSRSSWFAGFDDAHPLLRRGGDDVRESIGLAEVDDSQHSARLGPHASGVRLPRSDALCLRLTTALNAALLTNEGGPAELRTARACRRCHESTAPSGCLPIRTRARASRH
jgi:inorganic phosphate transporter, PiT family